jgi:hypothetical protein
MHWILSTVKVMIFVGSDVFLGSVLCAISDISPDHLQGIMRDDSSDQPVGPFLTISFFSFFLTAHCLQVCSLTNVCVCVCACVCV